MKRIGYLVAALLMTTLVSACPGKEPPSGPPSNVDTSSRAYQDGYQAGLNIIPMGLSEADAKKACDEAAQTANLFGGQSWEDSQVGKQACYDAINQVTGYQLK
jgi:hypothetical protein